jgi:hypothetical protein
MKQAVRDTFTLGSSRPSAVQPRHHLELPFFSQWYEYYFSRIFLSSDRSCIEFREASASLPHPSSSMAQNLGSTILTNAQFSFSSTYFQGQKMPLSKSQSLGLIRLVSRLKRSAG